MPWAALIGAAVSLVKLFATSAASSAGAAAGQLIVSRIGDQGQRTIVEGSQPSAPRQVQVSASQELLALLKNDAAFRDEVRSILAAPEPEAQAALATGQQVEKHLEQTPELVQEVVNGSRSVTDLAFPLQLWNMMSDIPLSQEQTRYLQSDTFHHICPVGGEDLGAMWDVVHYENTFFATPSEVKLPTVVLPAAPEHFVAVCKNGHRWPVFAH